MAFDSVDAWLADARSHLRRLSPEEAAEAAAAGAILVDIRPEWQRRDDGEIPGSVVIETNHIAWRVHPESEARLTIAEPGQSWVLFCTEGYTSSLVADALVSLGLDATDVVGGIHAWRAAGLPTTFDGPTPIEHRVGDPTPIERVDRSAMH